MLSEANLYFYFNVIRVIFVCPDHNGEDVEYAMIVVDENNSTINELDSPSMKVGFLHFFC